MIAPQTLGSRAFRQDYGVKEAYVAGAMVKGIASAAMVIRMGQSGRLAFLGSGGVPDADNLEAIRQIQSALPSGAPYGINVLADPSDPARELRFIDLLLGAGVRNIEASAFVEVTDALLKFRLTGLTEDGAGHLVVPHRIIAKISRPEVSAAFLSPPDPKAVARLRATNQITEEEAALAPRLSVASDLTIEADSGGHTDMGVTSALLPFILHQRDDLQALHRFASPARVGSAGGIGTPEAAACAFMLGADFIATGSINQSTVEAGTSAAVKDVLQQVGVRDTAYAPAGDMFELGAKVQVLKKGIFFPARANKLYDLWRTYPSLDAISPAVARDIQDKYFQRSFTSVFEETCDHYAKIAPDEIGRAERNPKVKMALIFRWYFVHSMRLALAGDTGRKVDWQVYCGPSLGAFNRWVKGTELENWQDRHVDILAETLMHRTADYLSRQIGSLSSAK